jgi:Domain of unknown function (DUF5122) beta-propeller
MSVKGILAATAVVTASLVSAGVTRPAFAAGGGPGSIDTSFGHNGTAVTDLGPTAAGQAKLGTPTAVVVLGNGDILIGGDTGVARLLPGGSLDPAFGSGGVVAVGFPGGPIAIPNLTVQPDGKILWVGSTANTRPPRSWPLSTARSAPRSAAATGWGYGPAERAGADACADYLENRQDYLDYPAFASRLARRQPSH